MRGPGRDAMVRAALGALTAAARLSEERALPPADVLREQMLRALREFVTRAREAGIPDPDVAEARYALVAFIDDRVLKSSSAGSAEWRSNPLQLQFYREFNAGENFFVRMRALAQREGALLPLEAYYLCLALGFVGALPSAAGPDGARPLLEAARARLLAGCNPERIAPHAVPTERRRPHDKPFPVAWATAAACLFIGAFALAGLHVTLGHHVARTAAELTRGSGGVAPSGEAR